MSAEAVLKFWFEDTDSKLWFEKNEDFDSGIRVNFLSEVEAALNGERNDWANEDTSAMALVIMLDQFTRNLFRGSPKSFAGDTRALATSLERLGDGFLQRNEQNWRYFMLMPMMHSENLAVQKASLPLFAEHAPEKAYEYAVKHHDIIERFARFPHRNEVLGRQSTPEEIEFLKQPGSSF